MFNKIKRVIDIIILIVLIPILLTSVVLIAKSYIDSNNVPSVLGYSPLIVLSGSMEPQILTGDLVVVKSCDTKTLNIGDVIAFYTDTTRSTVVTHRINNIIIEDDKIKYETKGDNNETIDSGLTPEELVVGKYTNMRFHGLGNAAIFIQTPTGMCSVISIPVLILIISQGIENRKNRKEIEELRKHVPKH